MSAAPGHVGIGLMGLPVTLRLLAAGHSVTVWNRTRAKIEPALAKGATEGADAADVARRADVVFPCLTDGDAVEDAVFGGNGIDALAIHRLTEKAPL